MKIVIEMSGVREEDKTKVFRLFENLMDDIYNLLDKVGMEYSNIYYFDDDQEVQELKDRINDLEDENDQLMYEVEELRERLQELENDF